MFLVKIVINIGFCMYRRSYLICPPVIWSPVNSSCFWLLFAVAGLLLSLAANIRAVVFGMSCARDREPFTTPSTLPSLLLIATLLKPQSRFGDKPFIFQVVCPQNGTAVLKYPLCVTRESDIIQKCNIYEH